MGAADRRSRTNSAGIRNAAPGACTVAPRCVPPNPNRAAVPTQPSLPTIDTSRVCPSCSSRTTEIEPSLGKKMKSATVPGSCKRSRLRKETNSSSGAKRLFSSGGMPSRIRFLRGAPEMSRSCPGALGLPDFSLGIWVSHSTPFGCEQSATLSVMRMKEMSAENASA